MESIAPENETSPPATKNMELPSSWNADDDDEDGALVESASIDVVRLWSRGNSDIESLGGRWMMMEAVS